MKFGNLIKRARNDANLTQEQLGIACGWGDGSPQGRVSNYEKDKRDVTASDIATIAKATNKPVAFFYGETSPQPLTNQKTDTQRLTQVIQKLEQIILENNIHLTPEQKAKAISACMSLTNDSTPLDTTHIQVALQAVS